MQRSRFRALSAKVPINEALLGLAVLISACISIRLTSAAGGIALFWPCSAIGAALLIRFRGLRCGPGFVAIGCALALSDAVAAHQPWLIAAGFAAVNLSEIALMVAAFRHRWVFPYPEISTNQAAIMTVVFGFVIPGMAALLGGLILDSHFGFTWAAGTLAWWSSHALGACLLGPPIILFSRQGLSRLLSRRRLAENVLSLIVCAVGCLLAIQYLRFPFVSISLLLLIAAFRLGGFGASLMSLAFGMLITNLWALGIVPIGLDAASPTNASLANLPVIALLATVMPSIAVGLGIDARRAAARALRLSERRFRESMEHSPIGMLIADLNGVWGFTNLALQEMLGYTAEEFRQMPPGGPSKPEHWDESKARWTRLISGEINYYELVRSFQHKNGHWIWAQVAVSLLRDDAGNPQHLIAQIESLEARRQAEQKLATERERLEITLASIKDAVVTTDASTRITYINAAAEGLLGLLLNAVQGRRVDEVVHLMDPDSAKSAANLIGRSAFHGKLFQREKACVLHRADGTLSYIMDVVSPVFDNSGLLSAMVIVFHDVTRDFDRTRELTHRALHDPLTGLSNRADFSQRLQEAMVRSAQLDRPAAILMIDLDRFKAVNDTGGHAAGDAVLRQVAQTCTSAVRSSDTVARLGGDEFAIMLDNCPREGAESIANGILCGLNPLTVDWEGSSFAIGASMGLAMYDPDMKTEAEWLSAADDACYAAKREGRGCLRTAAPLSLEKIHNEELT